ncbi:Hypothetical protein NTJ_12589 [Nesidiocoris tenuis]|uniref:Uncharacterized protein n=1 Tax=Nesidiocoris tenuis TaxID=355587 RepID=A0ABN7B5T6_9HEMI|nr:Hypothetical protein NTJ_12584 [Nesidiocoris tenuis]BES99771.1 Hypothetical protein NTJ_12589 [Nesidiocoris tenuis]
MSRGRPKGSKILLTRAPVRIWAPNGGWDQRTASTPSTPLPGLALAPVPVHRTRAAVLDQVHLNLDGRCIEKEKGSKVRQHGRAVTVALLAVQH